MFSETAWQKYKNKVLSNSYEPKRHYHLDNAFNFAKHSNKIKALLKNADPDERLKGHSFLPFLKTISTSPRYKYDEDAEAYKVISKSRPIFLTGHFDKYLFGYYAYALNQKYQDKLECLGIKEIPIAYRDDLDGKSNIQFSKDVFDFVKSKEECCVLATDISSYFDNIDHSTLKENWCSVIGEDYLPTDQFKIFKTITNYRYIRQSSLLKHFKIRLKEEKVISSNLMPIIKRKSNLKTTNEVFQYLHKKDLITPNQKDSGGYIRGIPQGLSISAVLSNIYLIDFDQKIHDYVEARGGLYRRYCDDIIVVIEGSDFKDLVNFIHNEIVVKRKLEMKASKTEIAVFQKRGSRQTCTNYSISDLPLTEDISRLGSNLKGKIQYLGFTFDGEKTLVRNSSLSKYYAKMAKGVRKTVKMAYGRRSKNTSKIYKRKLYERYTHLGKRTFISYLYRAASESYTNVKRKEKYGHNSPAMKKQVRNHVKLLQQMIRNRSEERFRYKSSKGKTVRRKK